MQLSNSNKHGPTGLAVQFDERTGQMSLRVMVSAVKDESPSFRQIGMGPHRYLRNVLESAVLQRGGLWPVPIVANAQVILGQIDNASAINVHARLWIYQAIGDEIEKIADEPWDIDPTAQFSANQDLDKLSERNFSKLSSQILSQVEEETERVPLVQTWENTSFGICTGLLNKQALLERRFLSDIASDGTHSWPLFHELVSARYIRTLCLLHRCEQTHWEHEILWPEITELGRTILLLSCCGWLKEANELAHRARHMILSPQNQFVPLVPWFGIAWGAQTSEVLPKGAVSKFHQPTFDDVSWLMENWRTDDVDELGMRLGRITDRRRWMLGQFDDEYHIDYDDGFSWVIPYEAGAIMGARQMHGLSIPKVDHPLFELPTARFELAQGPVVHYQDIYHRFINDAD